MFNLFKILCSPCCVRQFFSPESIGYIYKSTIHPCLEYCCYIWSSTLAIYFLLLDKIQSRISNIIGLDLAAQFQSLSHCCKVASLCLFYKYVHGNCSDELFTMLPTLFEFKCSTQLASRSH